MKTTMRHFILLILFLSLKNTIVAQQLCPIIPAPQQTEKRDNTFSLNRNTPILVSDDALKPVAHFLQKELLRNNKIPLSIQAKTEIPAISLVLLKKSR